MTTSIVETEKGLALLLPRTKDYKPGEVDVVGASVHGFYVRNPIRISHEDWSAFLLGPEEDAGIELVDDPLPEPVMPLDL